MSPTLSPLRRPAFRLLVAGQATSTLGSSFAGLALAFAVLQVTGSVADVGLALGATRLPVLVFVLLGGVAGDRWPRRRVMMASDLIRFGSQGAAAVLLLTGRARLWELLLLLGVSGFAQAFFNPAAVGLVPELVDAAQLQPANALLDLSRNASGLAGQLLGGALVTLTSPGMAFAVDSLSYLVSVSALALLPLDRAKTVRATAGVFVQLREGWGEFRSRRWLWIGVLHISLLNSFALVGFFALGPVVAVRDLGGGIAWGFVGGAFAGGLIAGSALASRWRPERPLLVAFAVVGLAAPQLALLAHGGPLALVVPAAFLGGGQASLWGALWTTTMQREIPTVAIARVAAYAQVGSLALAPAGYAVVGLLAGRYGTAPVLWTGAAWVGCSTAIVVALPPIRGYRVSSGDTGEDPARSREAHAARASPAGAPARG